MNHHSPEVTSNPLLFTKAPGRSPVRAMELTGILALLALAVWCVKVSWRKWPDPIVDYGQQLYTFWRVAQGGALYHDFIYSYGPLSVYFNAGLFRLFGPGIMVLATANLFIYALILGTAYAVFRRAWGGLAAFAACAVFIAVFSFSQLRGVANYNYVTPYSAESVHGILLILLMAPVACRWQREPSRKYSFLLGLGGGLSAVLKPEFMLAMAGLGAVAILLRLVQRKKIQPGEIALLLTGALLPTLLFTLLFVRHESWRTAFIDASQAWWLVVVGQVQNAGPQQWSFSGLDHPASNFRIELLAALRALLLIAGIGFAGWTLNRRWSPSFRLALVIAVGLSLWLVPTPGGWKDAGQCLPGLILLVLIALSRSAVGELRLHGAIAPRTVMAWLLGVLAAALLARMILFARIWHLGFFQAALAAMVVVAFVTAKLPQWVGSGMPGRILSQGAFLLLIATGGFSVMQMSRVILDDQTEVVGSGRDRFYATIRNLNETGALVNWAAIQTSFLPPDATVLVLPEGTMINYLSRHRNLEPAWMRDQSEKQFVAQLRTHPPDYLIFISRDLHEFGMGRFGTPGNLGWEIVQWMRPNYTLVAGWGGDPLAITGDPGVRLLRYHQIGFAPGDAKP